MKKLIFIYILGWSLYFGYVNYQQEIKNVKLAIELIDVYNK